MRSSSEFPLSKMQKQARASCELCRIRLASRTLFVDAVCMSGVLVADFDAKLSAVPRLMTEKCLIAGCARHTNCEHRSYSQRAAREVAR